MSRFADPGQTKVVALGPCQCPGAPHAQDEATVREQLGVGDLEIMQAAGWIAGDGRVYVMAAAQRALLVRGVVAWNLLGPDGQAAPVNTLTVAALDDATFEFLAAEFDGAQRRRTLPNVSGAPSQDS